MDRVENNGYYGKRIALNRFKAQATRAKEFGDAINADSFVDDMVSDLATLLDAKYACKDFSEALEPLLSLLRY